MKKYIYTHPIDGEVYETICDTLYLEPGDILWEGEVNDTPDAGVQAQLDASALGRETAKQAAIDGKAAAATAIKNSTSNATLKAALIDYLGIE